MAEEKKKKTAAKAKKSKSAGAATKTKKPAAKKASTAEVVSRDEIVRFRVRELVAGIGNSYLELAFMLHEVWENSYFIKYGFSTFKAYCEGERVGHGKARKLVAVAEKIKKFNIRVEDIEEIGWSKMSTISGVLTEENKKELVSKAKNKPLEELVADVRAYREGVMTEGSEKVITLTVRMNEQQSSIILDALERAKSEIETDSISLALEHLAYSWVMSSEKESDIPMEQAIAWVEKTYGVTLEVSHSKNIDDRLEGGLR